MTEAFMAIVGVAGVALIFAGMALAADECQRRWPAREDRRGR